MDKATTYRKLIIDTLTNYAEFADQHPIPGVEMLLVFDEYHDQYLWLRVGWAHERRIQAIIIHARIRNTKIWVEQDWTEDGIATDLIAAGVPSEDIVLAFHEPDIVFSPDRMAA